MVSYCGKNFQWLFKTFNWEIKSSHGFVKRQDKSKSTMRLGILLCLICYFSSLFTCWWPQILRGYGVCQTKRQFLARYAARLSRRKINPLLMRTLRQKMSPNSRLTLSSLVKTLAGNYLQKHRPRFSHTQKNPCLMTSYCPPDFWVPSALAVVVWCLDSFLSFCSQFIEYLSRLYFRTSWRNRGCYQINLLLSIAYISSIVFQLSIHS